MARSRAVIGLIGFLLPGAAASLEPAAAPALRSTVPTPEHVVVAVLENHSFAQIIGGDEAPFLGDIARRGATFTRSFAVAHPSQPNYFALYSGSTWGIADNRIHVVEAPTLATELHRAGKSFVGFVEPGSPRKHNPWESFVANAGFAADMKRFPSDFSRLPTVSFVVPNLEHDMHDGSVAEADAWLRRRLGAYAAWCERNDGLLIVTFDEDNGRENNQIPTVFFGRSVRPGQYDRAIDHYTVLRTIEAMYGLPALGESARREPIGEVWRPVPSRG
jgi:acid phosphatase